MKGVVYLVGAGPGDPELITRRAQRRLAEADVVLYDALVHPDILEHCRPGAERVFVGKRAGRESERQTNINARMIAEAQAGKMVVRLKGGDPYLFGRGAEEAESLTAAGIRFEVVPGVPSPLAATAYAGIAPTHRDLSSSIAYVTATESIEKDETSHDWSKLATATQTLVLFMGIRHLDHFMALLMKHGRPASTPAAVIQSASLPSQRTVIGTVATIARRVAEERIGMPALVVVGPVVQLRDSLRWFDAKPLFGKRVLVTRPIHQASSLAVLLRDEAADPIVMPTIRIEPPLDEAPLARAIHGLSEYSVVVFTSHNGVARFFDALHARKLDARALGTARVAAIGPGTARTLRENGVHADFVPEEFRGESMAQAIVRSLGNEIHSQRVLLPRAASARDVVPERLRAAGASVDVVSVYRTLPLAEAERTRLRELLANGGIDIVTFTSSSTVTSLVDAVGEDAPRLLASTLVGSIGPITTKTAEDLQIRVDVTASEYTIPGLVAAIRGAVENADAIS